MADDATHSLSMTAHTLAPGPVSAAEMRSWKALVADAVATGSPLSLQFHGGANPITAYRLYYMLWYAKDAGVIRLSLRTNGTFLDDEAAAWIAESRVDEIVIPDA